MRLLLMSIIILGTAAGAFARPGALVWHDEFDGSSLSSAWTNGKFWWGGDSYNDPDHVYRSDAVNVSNGILSLTLRNQQATSWQGDSVNYVSGLVQTGGIQGQSAAGFKYQYGYAEARIKMPAGQGIWPAFWTLPASYKDGDGELDIAEYIGEEPNNVYNFVHTHGQSQGGSYATSVNLSSDWHTYGMDWEPTYLKFYLDGVLTRTITNAAMIPNEPEYLILNLQTGGSWAGFPNASTVLPSTMQVDYVRVYANDAPEPAELGGLVLLIAAGGLRPRARRTTKSA